MDFVVFTPIALIAVAFWHIWRGVLYRRREEERREFRGGVKPWWGSE